MLRSKKAFITLLALLTLLYAVTSAQAATRLRFANFPAAETFPCISMERWADEVRKKLGDSLEIQTFPGGTLLDAKNMVRGVVQGQADIGCISLAYHPGAYPLLSAFELPLGFATAEAASGVLWDLHEAYKPAETSKVKVIALFTSAPSQIMSTKPLRSPADIKGMTIRSAGVLADVAESMGMRPVSMPQSDAPEALQKGMVQGIFSSLDVMKDYNFAESCRHGLIVNSSLYPFMVFMNMKKWNSLPKEVQDAIMEISREHSVWTGKYVDAHGKEAREWSKETYGAELNELSKAELEELRAMSAPVVESWKTKAAAKGIDGEKVLSDIAAGKNRLEGE